MATVRNSTVPVSRSSALTTSKAPIDTPPEVMRTSACATAVSTAARSPSASSSTAGTRVTSQPSSAT